MTAPVKPDPGATTPPSGTDEPRVSPIAAALAAAREAQRSGKPMLPASTDEETPPAEEPGETPDDTDEDDGTDDAAGTEDEGEAEGEDEAESDDDEAKPPESEDGKPPDTTVEAGEAGEGEVDPDLIVALPPRREGDDEFELVVENKEAAERIRQLRNGYLAGSQVRALQETIDQERAQIEELEVWIGTDPAGFILQNVPATVIEDVALSLVFSPDLFEKVKDKLQTAVEDDRERRVLMAELKAKRSDAKDTLRQVLETRKFAKGQAILVRDAIAKMVPVTDGITDTRRQAIIQTLESAAADTIRKKRIAKVEIDDVPIMLAAQLRAAGIDPLAAAQALHGDPSSQPGKRPAKKKPQPTRQELKAASEKRKRATASTPPGGGAPAGRTKLPKGQTLEERFKLAREKGLGALLGR
ncbi:MAG: hypothetical protein OEO20_11565 [Gemmatimonadota bacterium]|nr:hypothetical protein [Gemmatimonadota bacterium]MDH3367678.1 hypothetical protein [Gemmatimonadota bacterium]MDH3478932.1 hypothetical protein [Gemmatimonadota bacterium]